MVEVQDRCMAEYKKLMDEFPVLTREQEKELLVVINKYKGGKARQQARETLFNSNIRLVLKEASQYQNVLPLTDLMSAGCEGLWIATERFNPKFKTKFSTYAVPWIRLKLFRTLKVLGTMVYIPTNVKSKSYKYKAIMEEDKNLSDAELMAELQVSKKGLDKIRLAQHYTLSIDHLYQNGDKEDESAMINFLPNEKAENPRVEAQIKERREIIHQVLDELTPVQKDILIARYLNGDKVKLATIGKKWKITGERVRQIEFEALKKMRRKLKSRTTFHVG